MKPTPGRIVMYRSRTGKYSVPAIITCTSESLYQPGVDAGHVKPLTGDTRVHLDVRTPGAAGNRIQADDFVNESEHGRQENVGGGYQEFNIEHDPDGGDWSPESTQKPGTWAWPPRA